MPARGSIILFVLFTSTFRIDVTECATLTEARNLQTALLTNYSTDITPVADQSTVLIVSVGFYLRSIQSLDEINGDFFFVGAFSLSWIDASMIWDPSSYGGLTFTYISYTKVWVPEFIIVTTSDASKTMIQSSQRVFYVNDGSANILVGGRIKASCDVNVKNYPFDTQICKVLFQAWGYSSSQFLYFLTSSSAYTNHYSPNAQWDLTRTELVNTTIDGWAAVEVSFHLARRSVFTLVSMIAPLALLSALNVFVFVLVPDSGERVSYAVTVLLAIAVFMTIISEVLPNTSSPVPVITYKLMADVIISVLITVVTILNLNLYHRDDQKPVPECLKALYRCLCCKRNEQNVVSVLVKNTYDNISATKNVNRNVEVRPTTRSQDIVEKQEESNAPKVTWKNISVMIDYIALVGFSFASILAMIVYVVIAST